MHCTTRVHKLGEIDKGIRQRRGITLVKRVFDVPGCGRFLPASLRGACRYHDVTTGDLEFWAGCRCDALRFHEGSHLEHQEFPTR